MARAPRSTANFISYDLRPAKQSERRILLDMLKLSAEVGLPIASYRYVGMGANRFYDFLLMHKYLGLGEMVSLEHSPTMFARAVFNCPYQFIKVEPLTAAAFVAQDQSTKPTAYWFDYDGGIGPSLIQDINSLAPRLRLGDFFFVTAAGGPPGVLDRASDEARLIWLQDNLGDVSGDVTIADVERSAFPTAVHKVLKAAFSNAFAARRDGRFFAFLQIEYADSFPMVTVGGALLTDQQVGMLVPKIRQSLPFMIKKAAPVLYQIKSLHLTERERVLFDRATTGTKRRSAERNQLKKLGFGDVELAAYKDMLRYFPRYVETIV